MNAAAVLRVSGETLLSPRVDLRSGWNLGGYPSARVNVLCPVAAGMASKGRD
jgi:acid phosphatase family membrane protein YuiD